PVTDVEVIQTELVLADLEQVERRIDRLSKQVKGDRKLQPALELAQALSKHLSDNRPALSFQGDPAQFEALEQELRLLTNKPTIFAANVDEAALAEDNAHVKALRELAAQQNAEV